jgi:hypothetical protein
VTIVKHLDRAKIVKRKGLPEGNVSYIETYRKGTGNARFFINQIHGSDMNKNAGFTGTPDGIHNGTDSVLWTGSNLVGTNFIFNSTAQAFAGTHSIDATSTANGDEALFKRGSTISSASYIAISGAVYITRWGVDDNVTLRLRNNGVNVGNTMNLSSYINTSLLNTWQKFTIALLSFTPTTQTIDELVVHTVNATGTSPRYYLDALQLEESGGSIEYKLEPLANTRFHVIGIGITVVDNIDSTYSSSNNPGSPKLTWNKFLGLNELPVGVVSTSRINNEFSFTGIFRNHIDFATYPNTTVQSGGDTTSQYIKYDVDFDVWGGTPLVLDSRYGDYLSFIVNDDLSGLLRFRILANGIDEPIVSEENDNSEIK